MILPTIAIALHILWRSRHDAGEMLHALAVVFWIMANSIWMIGEFFYDDGLRPWATLLFTCGIMAVALYYLVILPRRNWLTRLLPVNTRRRQPVEERDPI